MILCINIDEHHELVGATYINMMIIITCHVFLAASIN